MAGLPDYSPDEMIELSVHQVRVECLALKWSIQSLKAFGCPCIAMKLR